MVGATPFWLAARFSQPGVMRLLVKHGVDPPVCTVPSTLQRRGGEGSTQTNSSLISSTSMNSVSEVNSMYSKARPEGVLVMRLLQSMPRAEKMVATVSSV